ncbi:MAG: tRNA epoxyqueuosine(34) reductase QueG [Hyphomicrobiaceae bacterium]
MAIDATARSRRGGPLAPDRLKAELVLAAKASGFETLRVTTPDAIPQAGARLAEAIASGHLGEMDWMADTLARRVSPKALWPDVRSVIVLAMSHGREGDAFAALKRRSHGVVAGYAKRRDYHDVVKSGLKAVARRLVELSGAEVKVFVDTAPVMEKPLAAAAGLGWQGRHTNLVSRGLGSWFLIGVIYTTAELPADAPESDRCGSCRRCLDICPTGAFPAPNRLDARRCISYLTIELKGPIPRELRPAIGNRVFGCDDCLAICPWNKFAKQAGGQRLTLRAEADDPPLAELLALDDGAFRARFAGTPVKRTGHQRFLRNVLIAAGNSGDMALVPAIRTLLGSPSALVRGAAVWALSRLLPASELARLRQAVLPGESDDVVREEWQAEGGPGDDGEVGPTGSRDRIR